MTCRTFLKAKSGLDLFFSVKLTLRPKSKKGKKATGIEALVKARERYEDGNSCGDEISKALECFRTEDGLDIDGVTACLKDNGCAVLQVDMERHGATGRFRMVAGLMLRAAAKKRSITIGDQTFGEKPRKKAKAKRGRKRGADARNQ